LPIHNFSGSQLLVLQISDLPLLYCIEQIVVQIPNYYWPCLKALFRA